MLTRCNYVWLIKLLLLLVVLLLDLTAAFNTVDH